jgi:uncharacterized protein
LKRSTKGISAVASKLSNDPEPITIDEARLISLAAQRLDLVPLSKSPPGKSDVVKMIRTLGTVQLDSISVVARSHETVLWSRLGHFDTALVGDLYHPDRLVTEYWAHAAAIIPVEMLPFFRRRMADYKDPSSKLYARWQPDVEVNEQVLATIRERGPLPSRAFERPDGPRPAAWSWWGGKPAKKALDYLWTCGDLAVVKREGFQRVYDLMERQFPGLEGQPLPSIEEQRRMFVTRALSALGIGTAGWVADYFRTGGQAHVSNRDTVAELQTLAKEGLAVPVALANGRERAWIDPAYLPLLSRIRRGKVAAERTTLLSPFDSLIWYRQRTLTLFDYDYRLESYTPAPKRQYGYYTLSILHRGRIVGRLDPSYDRRRRVLTVKAIHLEPGVVVTQELAEELGASLRDYCEFLGGSEVAVGSSEPNELGEKLRTFL